MLGKDFVVDAGKRAVNTVAQTILAQVGVGALAGIETYDWLTVLSVSVTAGVISVLMSVVRHTGGDKSSDTVADSEVK